MKRGNEGVSAVRGSIYNVLREYKLDTFSEHEVLPVLKNLFQILENREYEAKAERGVTDET